MIHDGFFEICEIYQCWACSLSLPLWVLPTRCPSQVKSFCCFNIQRIVHRDVKDRFEFYLQNACQGFCLDQDLLCWKSFLWQCHISKGGKTIIKYHLFSKNNITKKCSNFVGSGLWKPCRWDTWWGTEGSSINGESQYFVFHSDFHFYPCYLLLLLIIVFRYNTLTVQQYTFTLFQSSLSSSSLVPGNWSLYDRHHSPYHDKYKLIF